MLQSTLAVLAGFVVMAIVVMVGTALAVRLVLRVPFSAMRQGATPTPRYLIANLAASAIAALAGGYTTAMIAHHDALLHGLSLAALMLVMSLVSMKQAASAGQPGWYRVVLMTAMPALAVAGAVCCGGLAG